MSNAQLAQTLNAIRTSLEGRAGHADRRFLAVGEDLGAAIAIFGELSALFTALPEQLAQRELTDAGEALADVGRKVSEVAAALAGERAVLVRLAALNQDLTARVDGIRRTLRAVSMLAINGQIAAAGIPAQGEGIAVFTHRIMTLAAHAKATIEASARKSEELCGLLAAAEARQAAFQASHRDRLAAVSRDLEAAVRGIDRRRERAAATTRMIGRTSAEISREVGAAVMGLQIGDITRQRIEHVCAALAALADGLTPDREESAAPGAWSVDLSDVERHGVACRVCVLQSAQVRHTADEFDREVGRVMASLSRLAEEASALVRLGRDAYGADGTGAEGVGAGYEGSAGSAAGSFLDDLETRLNSAAEAIRICQRARSEVDRDVVAATATLHGMVERLASLREVEIEMRLVGLNTSLACGRIGQGARALAVIAHELRGCACQVIQEETALREVAAQISAIAVTLDGSHEQSGSERIACLERQMESALSAFADSGGQLGSALETLSREGARVCAILKAAGQGLDARGDVGRALAEARNLLDGTLGAMPRGQQPSPRIEERLKHFTSDRYTMASERDIHAALMTTGPVHCVAASAVSSAAPASLDDLLF